jgi:hypothetical protein
MRKILDQKWCFDTDDGHDDHDFFSTVITNNSVALVRKRTISTERAPLVGEVSANLLE